MMDLLTQICNGVERHFLTHNSSFASDTFQDDFVATAKDTVTTEWDFSHLCLFNSFFLCCFLIVYAEPLSI